MAKHPSVFLDRDGTLIEDIGYINDPINVEFYPFTFEALRNLQEYFLLFIITNQSGISQGLISEDEVKVVNQFIVDSLNTKGIRITDVYCCPHKNEDFCLCKKPKPFFINQAAELYDIDLSKSFIIGDHPSDVQCGINAGVTPIYLLTGHGSKHKNELETNVRFCNTILDASNFIISTIKPLKNNE